MASRRGGKHSVKDKDLTHTKYDDYTREQLVTAAKDAGCYVKDDKKSVMARKLADHDQDMMIDRARALQVRKEKEEQQQNEALNAAGAVQTRRRARARRNKHRRRRREYAEDVSSDSDDTEDFEERDRIDAHKLTVTGGEALSDESREDTDSESSTRSVNPRIKPSCKLRLFEWPYTTMPSSYPPESPRFERFPTPLPYTPLKLLTTHTNEKITLPGSKYPIGVPPDFVPILDPLTRLAARHGHTIGLLARATIESATSWAARTIISGWNGCMHFSLPPNDAEDTSLDLVYSKWSIDNALLLQPTPGISNIKLDRQQRCSQRLALKRKRTADVYEASKWRPLALAYMPASLDWEPGSYCELGKDGRTLEKLFFVRFPGCHLPHYYFWAREGAWADPTTADPLWSSAVPKNLESGEVDVDAPPARIRVRKSVSSPGNNDSCLGANHQQPTLASIEHDLLSRGLSATFARFRLLALSIGKENAWTTFTNRLPVLYPSGVLPCAPPPEGEGDLCLAEKVFALLTGRDLVSFSGQESWTRNDDVYWDVVLLDSPGAGDESEVEEVTFLSPPPSLVGKEMAHALFRRSSVDLHPHQQRKDPRILSWLDGIPSTFLARSPPLLHSPPRTPYGTSEKSLERPVFKPPRRLDPARVQRFGLVSASYHGAATLPDSDVGKNSGTAETCPFCSVSWSPSSSGHSEMKKARHMLKHSARSLVEAGTPTVERVLAHGVGARRRESGLSVRTLESYLEWGGQVERKKGKRKRL